MTLTVLVGWLLVPTLGGWSRLGPINTSLFPNLSNR